MSVKDIAPAFGLQARFLDDTMVVAQYLDSLAESSQVLTDTCVTFNARVLCCTTTAMPAIRCGWTVAIT